jgi:hypothetical protein
MGDMRRGAGTRQMFLSVLMKQAILPLQEQTEKTGRKCATPRKRIGVYGEGMGEEGH